MSEADITDYRFGRTRFVVGKLTAMAICEPQLRLGRRRHDNHCDECGELCDPYGMEKMEFPFQVGSGAVSERSTWENIRGMLEAEYKKFCLDCAHEMEQDGGQ